MEKLMDSLGEIERGIAELACTNGAFERIGTMLDDADDMAEASEYMYLLHIAVGFLGTVVTELDAAAGAAFEAAKAMR